MAKAILADVPGTVSTAVCQVEYECEETMLPKIVEALIKWAGNYIWTNCVKMKKFTTELRDCDHGRKIVVNAKIDVEPITPTIRQFCYQFIRLAEDAKKENERLRKLLEEPL
jgi:hypothetical protein